MTHDCNFRGKPSSTTNDVPIGLELVAKLQFCHHRVWPPLPTKRCPANQPTNQQQRESTKIYRSEDATYDHFILFSVLLPFPLLFSFGLSRFFSGSFFPFLFRRRQSESRTRNIEDKEVRKGRGRKGGRGVIVIRDLARAVVGKTLAGRAGARQSSLL